MNVIFLDFDGTLSGMHDDEYIDDNGKKVYSDNLEKRIAILAKVCKKYDCKIVIEASAKDAIDEETLEIDDKALFVKYVFSLFAKYSIECIGRTPNVRIYKNSNTYIDMWKELEIRKWLFNHPEVEHYCILDDNDTENLLHWRRSDLEKVKSHLVETCYYNKEHPELEGLLPHHEEEIGRVLKLDNEIRKLALKRKKIDNIFIFL